jgi:hypothetical protein
MSLILDKSTNLDHIIRYIKNEEQTELTPKQKDIMNKMMEADRLLYQYKDTQTVIKMLQAKFPGISQTTAWRMIQYAEYAMGPLRRVEKDYAKRLMIDDIWKEIEIYKSNRAKYHRSIASLYKVLFELYGFKIDDEIIDPDALKARTNVAVFILQNNTYSMDLDKMTNIPMEERQKMIDDIANNMKYVDYEDLKTKETPDERV